MQLSVNYNVKYEAGQHILPENRKGLLLAEISVLPSGNFKWSYFKRSRSQEIDLREAGSITRKKQRTVLVPFRLTYTFHSGLAGNVVRICNNIIDPVSDVEFAPCKGHIGMIPLNPTYSSSIVTEFRRGVEISSVAHNFDAPVVRIDDSNSILNVFTRMVLLNSKYQILMEGVNVEICISKLFGSIHDWLHIIDGIQTKNSVSVEVCEEKATIRCCDTCTPAELVYFTSRIVLGGQNVSRLGASLLNDAAPSIFGRPSFHEIHSASFDLLLSANGNSDVERLLLHSRVLRGRIRCFQRLDRPILGCPRSHKGQLEAESS